VFVCRCVYVCVRRGGGGVALCVVCCVVYEVCHVRPRLQTRERAARDR